MLNVQVDAPYTLFRFTADDYERLAEGGAFSGTRVELIEGVIVRRNAMGTPHKWAIGTLTRLLVRQVNEPHVVLVQCPIRASAYSVPEPDLSVVRQPDDHDEDASTADVSLVIEVSDSTRAIDLGPKARLYAAAGIAEYWVLDLQKDQLVVHTAPKQGRYTSVSRHGKTKTVTSVRAPRVTLKVADVLR